MRFSQDISVFNPYAIDRAVTSLGTSITQTAQEIRLEAQRTYATQDQTRSWISIKADEILSTVEDTYVDGTTFQSAIDQTPHTISLSVSGKVGKEGDTSSAGITVSLLDADGKVISTDKDAKIYLNGDVIFSSQLSTAGQTTINGGNITTGTISAKYIKGDTLTLGGANNANGQLRIDNGSGTQIGLWNNSGITISAGVIKLGSKTSLTDGNTGLYLSSGGIALGASNAFKVTDAGALTASNATVTGKINASSGTIGVTGAGSGNYWNIGGVNTTNDKRAYIYSGSKSTFDSDAYGVYIGTDGIAIKKNIPGIGNNFFKVDGGRIYSTWITLYDADGTRQANMVISGDSYGVKNGYYRVGFTNGIVTGAEGEDRSSNLFRNESVFYNKVFFMRRVEFEQNQQVHFYGDVYFHGGVHYDD